jgi:hypothetical protein
MRRFTLATLFLIAAVLCSVAKEQTLQVVSWPESGQPIFRFTFSKFKELGSGVGKSHVYVTDIEANNLSDKSVSSLNLSLYVFDKSKARIGEGYISLTNVGAGETVKFQITIQSSGSPSSVALAPSEARPHTVTITINSVPQGANFTLDGKSGGTTPKIVEVGVGKHTLEFSKEGYSPGKFPLEITPHDASGGSVSYELGNSSHDTIELRDGSVLEGDLISVSGMQVEVRIGGTTQNLDRNQIKRILLTERAPASN